MFFSQSLPNVVNGDIKLHPFGLISSRSPAIRVFCSTHSRSDFIGPSLGYRGRSLKFSPCFSVSRKSDSKPDLDPSSEHKAKSKRKSQAKTRKSNNNEDENPENTFPTTIPRKPRRGRRSEAVAVEDLVRSTLDRTFESIRQQNAEVIADKEKITEERKNEIVDSDSSDSDDEDGDDVKWKRKEVEEDDPEWPADADVGWGLRASEYFEQHPIKNVIGEDGVEIDWERELDVGWVQEINLLEWESFAFHPSPLVVLVFERYKRAADNWKALQELEKAVKVYWGAKDRLAPRTVKVDINIETDLAYALKVREGPQILFLRGDRIVYREKEIRTSEELVQMIAHFYYNAKKPSWMENNIPGPRYRS